MGVIVRDTEGSQSDTNLTADLRAKIGVSWDDILENILWFFNVSPAFTDEDDTQASGLLQPPQPISGRIRLDRIQVFLALQISSVTT